MATSDRILADIREAVAEGFFDRRERDGPSELERTSVLDLLKACAMMSRERRLEWFAEIGRIRSR